MPIHSGRGVWRGRKPEINAEIISEINGAIRSLRRYQPDQVPWVDKLSLSPVARAPQRSLSAYNGAWLLSRFSGSLMQEAAAKQAGQLTLTGSMAGDRNAIAWEQALSSGLATYHQNAMGEMTVINTQDKRKSQTQDRLNR
jgi:hypothetical protein|tara:strand:+ start:59 stop:481 length:423 start_codon:yes stop_codon:yes gene_type:complete